MVPHCHWRPDRVLQRVFDLGAVEGAVARGDLEFAARGAQALHQGVLGLVPALVGTDPLFGRVATL
jgi:hypothetical protein